MNHSNTLISKVQFMVHLWTYTLCAIDSFKPLICKLKIHIHWNLFIFSRRGLVHLLGSVCNIFEYHWPIRALKDINHFVLIFRLYMQTLMLTMSCMRMSVCFILLHLINTSFGWLDNCHSNRTFHKWNFFSHFRSTHEKIIHKPISNIHPPKRNEICSDARSAPTPPNQSKSFRVLQQITDTMKMDPDESVALKKPAELHQPHFSRPLGQNDMNEHQMRKMKLNEGAFWSFCFNKMCRLIWTFHFSDPNKVSFEGKLPFQPSLSDLNTTTKNI